MKVCTAVLAFTAMVAGSAAAQTPQRVTIGDEVACPGCRITYRQVVRIGDADGPGALGPVVNGVAVDGRGRYWVHGTPPQIFDAAGRFLQIAAPKGPGPGEIPGYGRPIALPGDSMLIADGGGNAIVFTPDLRIARRIRTPPGIGVIATPVQWPGVVLVSGLIQVREPTGWPIHALSYAGSEARVLKSFGHERESVFETGTGSRLAVRNGELWTIDRRQYRITRWNSRYEPVQIFERRARWWREPTTNQLGSHDTPPSPMAEAIAFDSEGLLWVFLTVGRDTWKAAWSRVPEGVREMRAGDIDIDSLLMTRIEVVDLERGRVVARADVPRRFVSALPGGRAAFLVETAEGLQQLEIQALSLQRR